MRILILTPTLPHPPIWGFNIRVSQIVRRLAARHEITLLSYADSQEAAARRALNGICSSIVTVPDPRPAVARRRLLQARATVGSRSYHMQRFHSPQMQSELTRALVDFRPDVVQVESSAMAIFDFGGFPVVLDEHNLEYELLRRSNAVEQSPMRRVFAAFESRKVEREEIALWRSAAGCAVTSRREEQVVNATVPDLPTAVVPNGVDLDYFRPLSAAIKPGGLVFTGLMTYRPNADGASHFVRAMFPAVQESNPGATFTAVGWGLPDDLRPLLGDRVFHTGRVEDVRPYLAEAAVVVVPLRIGSGTRLKVLEALAMSKAVVSTSVGCEGLDVKDGEHLLIADEPAAFSAAVNRLLRDPAGAARLGQRGRALVESRYGWEQSVRSLERFHESLRDMNLSRTAVAATGA